MHTRPTLALVLALLGTAAVRAQDSSSVVKLEAGQRAPASAVARFSTGPWATPKPRSACPVLLHQQNIKVAVYTRDVTSQVVHLMREVNALVSKEPSLKWSFVFVSHENHPTPTEEEFRSLIEKMKRIARAEQITHLSIGVMQRVPKSDRPIRAKRELGFVEEGETVVMLVAPTSQESARGIIRYVETVKSESLTSDRVQTIINVLEEASSKAIRDAGKAG